MLNVILGHAGLLPHLNLEELLIHMLLVSVNLLGIVLPNIEASKESMRYEVKHTLLLAWTTGRAA